MKQCTVKEIYTGKPDARDEVGYSSLDKFCGRMILPPKFELNNIINGDCFYIVGNKGVGKTAILLYIKQQLISKDKDSMCSMILFKKDYTKVKRAQLDKLQKDLISNLNIETDDLIKVRDFTKIWTLLIYSKIVNDNINSNYSIFENNTNWKSFEAIIRGLSNTNKDVLELPITIPKEMRIVYDTTENLYISVERVVYPEDENSIPLSNFYSALDLADKLFQSLNMLEHKYFVCIDELEAYSTDRNIFLRDLAMIRDLIITTKRINDLIKESHLENIKIVLSVRSEMIKCISNELDGQEFNKCIDGFEERISWGDGRGQGIHQPLFYVWLKRIAISANYTSNMKYEDIYQAWFPPTVGVENTVDFLLKRTWYKPRDIVRFMVNAQSQIP